MVKHNCAVVSYKKSVITLINGEKLPVTVTVVEVLKCRADMCMYACAKNDSGVRRRIIVLIVLIYQKEN